jgi:hypothetical protein
VDAIVDPTRRSANQDPCYCNRIVEVIVSNSVGNRAGSSAALPLAGTAALVTGASSGIGAATAVALAREGSRVALVARRQDRLDAVSQKIRDQGGVALPVEAGISDRNQQPVPWSGP